MLLPVGLVTGPFSVLGWLTPAVQEQTEALARTEEIVLLPAAREPALPAEPAPSFAIPEAVPAPEEAAPAAEGLSVLDVLAWLWLAGVLAVWGYTAPARPRLRGPMERDGSVLRPARVTPAGEGVLSVVIHEGRNRQVRRMCAAAGLRVRRLQRVREGELCLGALPLGAWRRVTGEEICLMGK